MVPFWIINYGSIAIGFLLALWLKKVSWKFLISFLIFSRIPDIISTSLGLHQVNHDYTAERCTASYYMLVQINLPDIIVLTLHSILLISIILVIYKLIWKKSEFSKFIIRLIIFSIAIAGFLVSLSNFWLIFSKNLF